MLIVKPGFEILTDISPGGEKELRMIADIARVCYKSTPKTDDIYEVEKFIERLIKRKHEAMLEHSILTVKFICDRGISHEIVRHRVASFAQESTRWCNYGKDKFGKEITVIEPIFDNENTTSEWAKMCWRRACEESEKVYLYLVNDGKVAPQIARSVLPTCLKTELVMTANYREWRHFFDLRTANDAHPQVRNLSRRLLVEVSKRIPVIFDDLAKKITNNGEED